MVIGSFFLFALLLLVMVRAFPVLEVPEKHEGTQEERRPAMPAWKRLMVGGSVIGGIALIAFGIAFRTDPEFFHPPAIWLSGIVLLLSVPFQICVLPERPSTRSLQRRRAVPHPVVLRPAGVGRYLASAAPSVYRTPVRSLPAAGRR